MPLVWRSLRSPPDCACLSYPDHWLSGEVEAGKIPVIARSGKHAGCLYTCVRNDQPLFIHCFLPPYLERHTHLCCTQVCNTVAIRSHHHTPCTPHSPHSPQVLRYFVQLYPHMPHRSVTSLHPHGWMSCYATLRKSLYARRLRTCPFGHIQMCVSSWTHHVRAGHPHNRATVNYTLNKVYTIQLTINLTLLKG